MGMILRTYILAGTAMNAFIGGAILIHPRVMLTAAHKVAKWVLDSRGCPREHQILAYRNIMLGLPL